MTAFAALPRYASHELKHGSKRRATTSMARACGTCVCSQGNRRAIAGLESETFDFDSPKVRLSLFVADTRLGRPCGANNALMDGGVIWGVFRLRVQSVEGFR